MIKNLNNFVLIFSMLSISFAGSPGKSHSAELLSRGRSVPIAVSDNFLVAAKNFTSLKSREVDIYLIDNLTSQVNKIGEILSPSPESGDDFGFSISMNSKYILIGAPGQNNGHGKAYLFKKNNIEWILDRVYDNPSNNYGNGSPDKFGYNVSISNDYLSISSPFNNDGLVYIYSLDNSHDERLKTIPINIVDVRKLGDVEGCYAEGPNKFGFGISTSFNDNKLLIGSLKDFVYLIEYKNGIPSGIDIPNPVEQTDETIGKSKFGENVHIGDKNIYISSLGIDNGKGKVHVYPFLSNAITDENPWSNSYEIQPLDLLENSHFGYRISENENMVSISTFNQAKIFNFELNSFNKLEQLSIFENDKAHRYFGRSLILHKNLLFTDAYYSKKLFIYDLNNPNRGYSNSLSTEQEIFSINSKVECSGGVAAGFSCNEIDLMSYLDKTQIGGSSTTSLNDIWGWTDTQTNKEYALVGMSNGTSFVDVSDPENPIYIGRLPTQTNNSSWRDIKVYQNYAFIVSEASGHGMQIFDLTELRNFNGTPFNFSNSAFYGEFGNAHNIFINEDTGYAYAIGTSTCGPGGLHIVDISSPTNPSKSACVSDPNTGRSNTGYVHDVQCVVYNGPDSNYVGKEICFGSNETNVWIADLSTKSDDSSGSKTIGLGSYDDYYTHQGWLTEDHKYFIQNDELDEYYSSSINNTRTLIWDVQDLSNPTVLGTYIGPTPSIDHNNYIIGNKVFMSHYTSGLRILDISDITSPTEEAYFDVYPANDNTSFDGTWSNYPYFESGSIVVTSIDEGLFVLKSSDNDPPQQAPSVTYMIPNDGSVTLYWDLIGSSSSKTNIYRSEEQGFTPSVENFIDSVDYPGVEYTDLNLDENITYYYKLSISNNGMEGPFSNELPIKPEFIPNQPPTIDVPSNVTFNEDSEYEISLTGISYGSDINPQNITISASADNTDLFSEVNIIETVPEKLQLVPNENKNGNSQITITVQDDGGVLNGGIDKTTVSFNATVLPVNDAPSSFNIIGEYSTVNGQIIPGSDNRTIYVNLENVDDDSIRFEWEAAEDIDGDNIEYKMSGEQGLAFLTMPSYTSNTFVTWSLKDLIAETDTISVSEGSWNVKAFDGIAETLAFSSGQLRIDGRQLIPKVLEIKQSYPNPFRNFTKIEYDVPSAQSVVLKVFNIKGQVVKTLIDEFKGPGYYSVIWDGTNDNGDAVSSGIYFCQMHTPPNPNGGQFVKAMKMVRIR